MSRSLVHKIPWILGFLVIGLLELQILRITDTKTGIPREGAVHSAQSVSSFDDDFDDDKPAHRKILFGGQSAFEDTIMIYNRVPKTASTSFMGVVYSLCEQNNFHSLHLNITRNVHVMSVADQMRFAYNITQWTDKLPALYHGHVQYINFRRLGVYKKILYINIIRKPLDRLVSYYYFLRFGDTFRPHKRRSRQGDKETFDECVERGHKDCKPEKLWLQIPFFCGHAPQCQSPGSRWALEQAKRHLVEEYLLVGLTEQLEDFILVLETAFPRFFKGATTQFRNSKKSHLRKTASKRPLQQSTIDHFHQNKIWKMENEFYEFARKAFNGAKKKSIIKDVGDKVTAPVQFFYEKIRPR